MIEQFVTSLSPIEPCVSHDSLLPKEDVNSSWPFAMYVRASSMKMHDLVLALGYVKYAPSW